MFQSIIRVILPLLISLILVTSCKKGKEIEGERISVLTLENQLTEDSSLKNSNFQEETAQYISYWSNNFVQGLSVIYPNVKSDYIDETLLNNEYKKITSLTSGNKYLRIKHLPVVLQDRIFLIDNKSNIFGFSNGDKPKEIWENSVLKRRKTVINGGISYHQNNLYITNGSDRLLKLNVDDGSVIWSKKFSHLLISTPLIYKDKIFVSNNQNQLYAIDKNNGNLIWQHLGSSTLTHLSKIPQTTVSGNLVITAYSSGEIYALNINDGKEVWRVYLRDITSDSLDDSDFIFNGAVANFIIKNNILYVAGYKSFTAAIDLSSGQIIWQNKAVTARNIWLFADHIYLVTNDLQLVAINKDTGTIRFITELEDISKKKKKQYHKTVYSSPIVINSQVLLIGSSIEKGSFAYLFDIKTGKMLKKEKIAGRNPIFADPILVKNNIYLIANNGTIRKY